MIGQIRSQIELDFLVLAQATIAAEAAAVGLIGTRLGIGRLVVEPLGRHRFEALHNVVGIIGLGFYNLPRLLGRTRCDFSRSDGSNRELGTLLGQSLFCVGHFSIVFCCLI